MTFNCHWIHHMMPHHIPICLADGSVVYSEGIGTVHVTAMKCAVTSRLGVVTCIVELPC